MEEENINQVNEDDEPRTAEKVKPTSSAVIISIRDAHNLQEVHKDGSKSPFTALPSLFAIAAILSYYGYSKKIKSILNQLSNVGVNYWQNHQELLKGFIVNDGLHKHAFFGSKGKQDALHGEKNKYFEFPTADQYEALPGQFHLQSLSFKAGNFKSLSGIQIVLTNGMETLESPLFSGNKDNDPLKKMHSVQRKHIAKVSMRIQGESSQNGSSQSYFGLNLYDDSQNSKTPAMTADWGNKGGKTETIEVPKGHELVGFHGYIWDNRGLCRLGMITSGASTLP